MKLIIDLPELDYECAKQRWMMGYDAHKIDYYISKGTLLDRMTNGEVMITLCPNLNKEQLIWFFGEEWWNSPYQKGGE